MKTEVEELAFHTESILKALDKNEPVTLLHRGREKAVIMPISKIRELKICNNSFPGMKSRALVKDRESLKKLNKRKTSQRFILQ